MRVIYQAENQIDANLVKGLLEQAGIRAFVAGEYLQGGVGDLPASGLITVSVVDQEVEGARRVVEQYEANVSESTAGESRWDHLSDNLLSWKG